jgi:hypothetical protein
LFLLVLLKIINNGGHDGRQRESQLADRIAALTDAVFHPIGAVVI